jgi:hypothetical protein
VHGVCEERGCKEYKVLEVIVKGWKAKVVKVALEMPPKKCVEGTKSDNNTAGEAVCRVSLHLGCYA